MDINGGTANRTGTWANLSDARLKTDVHLLTGSLQKVKALKGVIPEWVKHGSDGFLRLGKVGVEASFDFRDMLKVFQMTQSMSRRGNCCDNAVGESIFHTLQVELVHEEDFHKRKEAKEKIIEYIEFFHGDFLLNGNLS